MAYTTKVSVGGTNLSSPSRNYDITIVASRASLDAKKVTATVKVTEGFGAEVDSTSKTAYRVYFTSDKGTGAATGTLNPSGTTWKWGGSNTTYLLNSSGSTYVARKPFKSATATNIFDSWTDGKTRTFTVKLYEGANGLEVTRTLTLSMPKYQASGSGGGSSTGGGSDGGISRGKNTLTFSANPTTITEGNKSTLTMTAKVGTNNNIALMYIIGPNDKIIKSEAYSGTSKTIKVDVYPTKTSTYTAIISSDLSSQITKTAKITVNPKPPSKPTNCYVGSIEGSVGGSQSVSISCNCNSPAYYSIDGGTTKKALTESSYLTNYYSGQASITEDSTVIFYGSDDGKNFSAGVSKSPSVTYSTTITNFSVTPTVLKVNSTTPDLVITLQSGYVNAETGSGSLSYDWEYAQSSTISGLSSASWQSLGVSGDSFSSLDMTQKVAKGYYYKVRATATNDSYYSSDISDESEIYQIPTDPGRASITEVIPKADPSEGYTTMIQDGKTYYGSGLFVIWNNPTIGSSNLDIAELELIYQSKSSSSSTFSEIKVAQIKYHEVLREGATNKQTYVVSSSSGVQCGGGANLEVNSLEETRIGVRVTDILGQSTDTFYSTKNFYKAESPGFGGNLKVDFNEFRPFTADSNGLFTFYSSVAQSNSQDTLYYYINCWIGERKSETEIIKNIPISYQGFTSATTNTILYSDDNITIKKKDGVTLSYDVKNSYLSNLFLSNAELREVKNSLEVKFNNDFTDAVYKIYVKDSFDASSTTYNSTVGAVRFIESPTLSHNSDIQMGINRYRNSKNPFYGNDGETPIVSVNNLSENNDRMINPSEGVIFKFKPARDYNGLDYNTTMRGDVVGYNIYVSRNDEPVVSDYDKLNYSLLKYYSVDELKKAKPNDSNDEYYYLEYPLTSYQESKFIVFKIEAVDSKGNKSDFIYSNTYLVPCRAQSMDFYINNVRIEKGLDNNYTITFKTKVNDFGASIFVNNAYGYDKENEAYAFPNYERRFTVSGDQFSPKGYLILEASLDGDFNNTGTVVLEKEETGNVVSQTFNNYFNLNIDLAPNLVNGLRYPDIIETEQLITNFPTEWINGIENKFVKKIFFKATYKIAYGFKNIESSNFDDRYLIVTSVSAPYSYYEDAPTVSYRNHQVGINTKDFSVNSTEGQKEVLIIQDNGSYNLVVFKGAEQKIILNLTDRSFYTLDSNDKVINEVNFGTGFINGMTIDGGSW